MKLKHLTSILIVLAFIIFHLNCGGDNNGENDSNNGVPENFTDVKVLTIKPANFEDFIEVTGTVRADIAATISSEEMGVIEKFLKDKGDRVKKGEVIAKLESKTLQASHDEAKASYLLSEATFKRQANLYQDKVISEQRYLEYKYSLDRDLARYENINARLEKTKIKSPIFGIIDDRLAEVGELSLPGTPLFKIVKIDVVKIIASVPERFITDVKNGSLTLITFDVLPDVEFEGRVSFVGPSIIASTRTFPIEIKLQNTDGQLKPEMFANIKIKKAQLDGVVVIPRDAIIETETGKFVFINQGNLASKREVKIGASYNNRIWISNGIKHGDELIVVGHRDLVDGERIAVHE